jgi:hypothetical protein
MLQPRDHGLDRDHGVIDQQTESDDEGAERDPLQVDPDDIWRGDAAGVVSDKSTPFRQEHSILHPVVIPRRASAARRRGGQEGRDDFPRATLEKVSKAKLRSILAER